MFVSKSQSPVVDGVRFLAIYILYDYTKCSICDVVAAVAVGVVVDVDVGMLMMLLGPQNLWASPFAMLDLPHFLFCGLL